MPDRLRIAVLISGTGSNLKALVDAQAAGQLDLDIVHVISNRAEAPGLDHARNAGIPYSVIDKTSAGESGEDEAVARCLREVDPDLVLLSGYMRILGAELVSEFAGRMINQHPSLLPRYKGLHTYRRVLAAGDAQHGASLHFVTAELDGGPIIAQTRIPVENDDDEQTLAARLGPLEHRLLRAVMELFSLRRVRMGGDESRGAVLVDGEPLQQPLELIDGELRV
jgi:phosphoribosylglycinamide formyltransferase-1